MPFFIVEILNEETNMKLIHVGLASLTVVFIVVGNITLGKGIQYGIAGPVEAIENSKVVVQTILVIIFQGKWPNILQYFGIATGFLGVSIIILQKKDEKS